MWRQRQVCHPAPLSLPPLKRTQHLTSCCMIPFPFHTNCWARGSFGLSLAAGTAPAGRMHVVGRGWGRRVDCTCCKHRHEETHFSPLLGDMCRHMPVAAMTIWCKTTGFVHPLRKDTIWGEHGKRREQWKGCCHWGGKYQPVVMKSRDRKTLLEDE